MTGWTPGTARAPGAAVSLMTVTKEPDTIDLVTSFDAGTALFTTAAKSARYEAQGNPTVNGAVS